MEATKKIIKATEGEIQYADGTGLVRLISYGWCEAIPAGSIKVGDHRAYNYGGHEKITKVEQRGGWVHITVTIKSNGTEWTRKSRSASLIPVATWVK